MRIYQDALEMIKEVERDLFEMGIRYQSYSVQDKIVENDSDYETIELIGTGYKLVPNEEGVFSNMEKLLEYKKDKYFQRWVYAEAGERLCGRGSNPGDAWKLRSEIWEPFIRRGRFSYSYAERWREQLSYVTHELAMNPNSRQVIMTMYDRHQDMMNWGGLDRVPCSLSYHFLIRDGRLNLIYNQRSCDFVNFFQADVYITITLQSYVANILGVKTGLFVHNINSLHAFKKDLKGVF